MTENNAIRILVMFVALCCFFEAAILGLAYFASDRVECNWLWCTFTTERSTLEQWTNVTEKIIINKKSTCYMNNVEVNCSMINRTWGDIEWPKEQ